MSVDSESIGKNALAVESEIAVFSGIDIQSSFVVGHAAGMGSLTFTGSGTAEGDCSGTSQVSGKFNIAEIGGTVNGQIIVSSGKSGTVKGLGISHQITVADSTVSIGGSVEGPFTGTVQRSILFQNDNTIDNDIVAVSIIVITAGKSHIGIGTAENTGSVLISDAAAESVQDISGSFSIGRTGKVNRAVAQQMRTGDICMTGNSETLIDDSFKSAFTVECQIDVFAVNFGKDCCGSVVFDSGISLDIKNSGTFVIGVGRSLEINGHTLVDDLSSGELGKLVHVDIANESIAVQGQSGISAEEDVQSGNVFNSAVSHVGTTDS